MAAVLKADGQGLDAIDQHLLLVQGKAAKSHRRCDSKLLLGAGGGADSRLACLVLGFWSSMSTDYLEAVYTGGVLSIVLDS